MNQDLYRLVYYSRNRVPAEIVDDQVQAILAASCRNNLRAGVTGALLFNTGCFGQVLEGTCGAVETTFERIQRDPRHGDVSLLAFAPAERRSFASWSMGFVGSDAGAAGRYRGIADESGFDPSTMSGDILFQTLERLARDEERRAA